MPFPASLDGMAVTPLRIGIATLVLGALVGAAEGQAVEGTVEVIHARARFASSARTGASRHHLKLTLQVLPHRLPASHDSEQHAIHIALDGTARRFTALVGIDDAVRSDASARVEFRVLGDGAIVVGGLGGEAREHL